MIEIALGHGTVGVSAVRDGDRLGIAFRTGLNPAPIGSSEAVSIREHGPDAVIWMDPSRGFSGLRDFLEGVEHGAWPIEPYCPELTQSWLIVQGDN